MMKRSRMAMATPIPIKIYVSRKNVDQFENKIKSMTFGKLKV